MRKPDFCLCENKGADQLLSKWEADQCLCFCYTDSTISLLLKSEFSSVCDCTGRFVSDLSEGPKTGFLGSQLITCLSLMYLSIECLSVWNVWCTCFCTGNSLKGLHHVLR